MTTPRSMTLLYPSHQIHNKPVLFASLCKESLRHIAYGCKHYSLEDGVAVSHCHEEDESSESDGRHNTEVLRAVPRQQLQLVLCASLQTTR
jgi:hypothetical protein